MNMSAIVLAGGAGTRMGDICKDIPKAMLEFNGRPFLEYLVSWLIRVGMQEVLISTCFLNEKIETYFNTNLWREIGVKVIQENEPLGTGGAVRFVAIDAIYEEIFLCNADTLVELDFPPLYRLARMIDKPMVSVVTLNKGVPNQGAIKVENGIVREFQEDGLMRELERNANSFRASSTGCYFVRKSFILSDVFQQGSSLEKEILPRLVEQHLLGAISCGEGFFLDYGTPQRYTMIRDNPWVLEKIYGL